MSGDLVRDRTRHAVRHHLSLYGAQFQHSPDFGDFELAFSASRSESVAQVVHVQLCDDGFNHERTSNTRGALKPMGRLVRGIRRRKLQRLAFNFDKIQFQR